MNRPSEAAPRAGTVERLARDLDLSLLGIAPAEPSDHAPFLRDWIARGSHGQMHYLADQLEQRLDLNQLVPDAASVICVAQTYRSQLPAPEAGEAAPARGRIARYALGRDYHRDLKKKLHSLADALRERWPGDVFRVAADVTPVLEREHARKAGLGWVGKNTMLIHPELGSYFVLGEIITTLRIQPASLRGPLVTDHCGTCTRCLDACPTQCLTPYALDARRCISYLTLEHRSEIEPSLHQAMGTWIAGCDVCQEVCPHNAQDPAASGASPEPWTLLELLNWDAAARQKAFIASTLKRIKLEMIKRNALIAAGNVLQQGPDPALLARIQELSQAANEPELVRETARQVLRRLDKEH